MTLTEALRLPGALNIETKVHGSGLPHDDAAWLTRLLIRRVTEADAGARVTLQSFDWRSLEVAHREAPWLQTVALFGTSDTTGVAADRRAGLPWPERSSPPSVTRSAGFENLALSADGRSLIAMLEKPLPASRECLALRFDLTTKAWAGVAFRFPLDPRATAVGDLTIAGRFAYALERDDSERRPDGFKRLVRFALPAVEGAIVQKHTAADLLDLALSDGGTFTFPFWTIEGVVVDSDGGVAIINDNNFPFGRGRSESEADETELIVIEPLQ
jgi:glycerophosphoryl diester phosphodiesterase